MESEIIYMIHGMWFGDWCWQNYKNFFEQRGYRCITPNLPFHYLDPNGEANQQLGTASLLDYADYLENEIMNLDSLPVIMGHSMGGLLAQILASRGLSEAAVSLTPASPRGVNALTISVLKSFSEILLPWKTWGFWRKPTMLSFEKAVYSMLHLLPPEQQKEVYSKMVYESGRAAFEIGFWPLDKRKASQVDHEKVKCPMLLIAGQEDRITPAKVIRKVAGKYKAVATYKEFGGHAHYVLGEPGWEDIAEYVFDWLLQTGKK